MTNYPQELAEDAVCQSSGSCQARPSRLNTNDDDDIYYTYYILYTTIWSEKISNAEMNSKYRIYLELQFCLLFCSGVKLGR